MAKVLLICPANREDVLGNVRVLRLPPMGLALLADYTPDEYELQIVDEGVEAVDLDTDADVVGITFMTPQAPRAYALADAFRARGIPVILGGVHASVLPEEAVVHADAIVIGEADEIWPKVVADATAGQLKQIYHGGLVEPGRIGQARRDLLGPHYAMPSIQTARGCPFNCNFCSVTLFNGGRYRPRAVDDVVQEIESFRSRYFAVVDDNVVGSGPKGVRRAVELFDALKGSGKFWGSQASINIADEEKLLRRAAAAGARWFFVGFESIDAAALRFMNKGVNLRALSRGYADAIKRIQDAGIAVIGGFIFGSDADTPDVFARTLDFVYQTRIDGVQLTMSTPFPGTQLFQQLAQQGRLLCHDFPRDWSHFTGFEVVFRPKKMTVEQLFEGREWIARATSSFTTTLRRTTRTLWNTKSLLASTTAYHWTQGVDKAILAMNPPPGVPAAERQQSAQEKA